MPKMGFTADPELKRAIQVIEERARSHEDSNFAFSAGFVIGRLDLYRVTLEAIAAAPEGQPGLQDVAREALKGPE